MKEQSPLQKVCMQYGKDCRALSNSYLLADYLRKNDSRDLASAVETAIARARTIARESYFAKRKELQPDWKDWKEQMDEAMAAEDYSAYRW